jgi:hypothetical protein
MGRDEAGCLFDCLGVATPAIAVEMAKFDLAEDGVLREECF